jgi:hypothetical protein
MPDRRTLWLNAHMHAMLSCAHVLAGIGTRTKDVYGSLDTYCSFENIAGLKINGMAKTLDSVQFGTYKYYQKFLNLKPKIK